MDWRKTSPGVRETSEEGSRVVQGKDNNGLHEEGDLSEDEEKVVEETFMK